MIICTAQTHMEVKRDKVSSLSTTDIFQPTNLINSIQKIYFMKNILILSTNRLIIAELSRDHYQIQGNKDNATVVILIIYSNFNTKMNTPINQKIIQNTMKMVLINTHLRMKILRISPNQLISKS